mmetsp:Transcript_49383/g.107544  ORF Transcript_49383/g.107544 Transcript_49383/m.107544 type:complete len:454 (-) Transcript_49383:71-1432(-)
MTAGARSSGFLPQALLLTGAIAAVLLCYGEETAFSAANLPQATSRSFAGLDALALNTRGRSAKAAAPSSPQRVTLEELRAFGSSGTDAPSAQRPGRGLLGSLAALVGLAVGARRGLGRKLGLGSARRAEAAEAAPVSKSSGIMELASTFCNLFALWLGIAAVVAIKYPPSFTWIPGNAFTGLLGLLMFSVGITTTLDDFRQCLKRPGAVAINFFSCYGIMPVLGYLLAQAIGAEGPILAGMVLVGSINGGQASNLCTLIAGGDVALSVLMTTSTTLGCILMTPAICKLVLGTVVPVDAMGIVYSTIQVVLAPIFLGVFMNTLVPKVCSKVAPYTPVVGVIATVLLVGASVAKCAGPIANAGLPLQFACLGLHLFGGLLGYWATKVCNYNERTCRTVAIETAMKSSAFGFLLASKHFGAFNARVPSAVSVVWMAIVGSLLAVYWKGKPTNDSEA